MSKKITKLAERRMPRIRPPHLQNKTPDTKQLQRETKAKATKQNRNLAHNHKIAR